MNLKVCRICKDLPMTESIHSEGKFKISVLCKRCDIVVNGVDLPDAVAYWNDFYGEGCIIT
jgi:hypothetical protein